MQNYIVLRFNQNDNFPGTPMGFTETEDQAKAEVNRLHWEMLDQMEQAGTSYQQYLFYYRSVEELEQERAKKDAMQWQ